MTYTYGALDLYTMLLKHQGRCLYQRRYVIGPLV